MTNETLITQEGLEQLKEELNELKSVRRIKVSKRIQEAIALGDLSENSEYDDAKNVLKFLQGEIICVNRFSLMHTADVQAWRY